MTKVILSEPKELLERRLGRLLDDCRAAGYSPMLEIGKPAARRQAIVVNAVYMRPLDGSDLSLCSCCAEPYDPVIKSRIAGNYIPINWCPVCRERLREGEARQAVYDDNAKRRRGKAFRHLAGVVRARSNLQFQPERIRSAVRLAERISAHPFPGCKFRQIFLAQRLAAP